MFDPGRKLCRCLHEAGQLYPVQMDIQEGSIKITCAHCQLAKDVVPEDLFADAIPLMLRTVVEPDQRRGFDNTLAYHDLLTKEQAADKHV